MDPTKQKNLFTDYPTAVDIGATIVSGLLLTLSPVSWINDPLSKTGVAFATLLNATLLGLGNKLGKTDKSVSPLYRNAITVVSLAASSFAASNLAPYLPQEFEVILSSNSAFYIVGFTLVAKVTIYVLYTLSVVVSNYFSKGQPNQPDDTSNSPKPQGNQKPNPLDPPKPEGQETPDQKPMPSFPSEVKKIAEFTKEELTHFHKQFQEKDGQRPFDMRYYSFRLAFLDAFEKNGIPIKDYELVFQKISDNEVDIYRELLWKYVKSADITQLDIERLKILHCLFENNEKDWESCPDKEKISYITQFLENMFNIRYHMKSFFNTTYWSHFGDVSKLDQKGVNLIYKFFKVSHEGKEKWETLPVTSQLYYLAMLGKEERNSAPDFLVCDTSKLTDDNYKSYHHIIWVIAPEKEVNSVFEKYFALSLPYNTFGVWKLDKDQLGEYLSLIIGTGVKVAGLSKNQLEWLQEIGKYGPTQSVFEKFSPEIQKELVEKLTKQFGTSAFKIKAKGIFAGIFGGQDDSPAKFPMPTTVEEISGYDKPKLTEFLGFFGANDEGKSAWYKLDTQFKLAFISQFENASLPPKDFMTRSIEILIRRFLTTDDSAKEEVNIRILYQFYLTKIGQQIWGERTSEDQKIWFIYQCSQKLQVECKSLKFDFSRIYDVAMKNHSSIVLEVYEIVEKCREKNEPFVPINEVLRNFLDLSLPLEGYHDDLFKYVDKVVFKNYLRYKFYDSDVITKLTPNQLEWVRKIGKTPEAAILFNKLPLDRQKELHQRLREDGRECPLELKLIQGEDSSEED